MCIFEFRFVKKHKCLLISKCMCLPSSRKRVLLSSSLSLPLKFTSPCVCVFALEETWEGPVSGQNRADRQMNMPKCDQERGKQCQKQGGGQEEEKTQRTWTMEKVEWDGAPDLTTLTHSGLSVLASCALWSTRREQTHTYIYLCTHAGDEDILGLSACVCVFRCVLRCDRLSKRAKESANATNDPAVCVCSSLPASVPLCSRPWTCMHICVCIHIFTRLPECAGARFHLFFLLGSASGQDIGV